MTLNLQYTTCRITMLPVFSLHFTHSLDLSYFCFSVHEGKISQDPAADQSKGSTLTHLSLAQTLPVRPERLQLYCKTCLVTIRGCYTKRVWVNDPATKMDESKFAGSELSGITECTGHQPKELATPPRDAEA